MAVDWVAIRKALRMRRAELQMNVNELQEKSGVSRTTIYRIENVADIPDHVMDLESVEALSTALGLTLSELFARISALTAVKDAPEDRSTPYTPGGGSNGARTVSTSAASRPLDDTNEITAANSRAVIRLAQAIDRLTAALVATREQTADTGADRSGGGVRPREAS